MDLTSCNAELESLSNQPNYNFFWLIDLMKCKKKTVNQSSKRNTSLAHQLQTIELCLTWTQIQSLLLTMVSSLLGRYKYACMSTNKNLKTAFNAYSVPYIGFASVH